MENADVPNWRATALPSTPPGVVLQDSGKILNRNRIVQEAARVPAGNYVLTAVCDGTGKAFFAVTLDGESAGHVAFTPAAASHSPDPDPRLAHLWQLFVRPVYWGTGVALGLHDAAIAEATARGYARMRLNTPLDQTRARRFYEREGWELAGEIADHGFGLRMVEYRRVLRS